MTISTVSLNALRAFEAAARHLSFTRAGLELSVTQTAISHQVKALEERLGVTLFRRTSKGLVLTDEGVALVPTLTRAFSDLGRVVDQFDGGRLKEVLTLGVVGTFAIWLMERLPDFQARHPFVDIRLMTNNNRVDLAGESLDYAIRFGDGAWHGTESMPVFSPPFSPLCAPAMAERLSGPASLAGMMLLRSYRAQDWPAWLEAAGVSGVVARGPQFDSSWIMVEAAAQGLGIALAPVTMFDKALTIGRLCRPFEAEVILGGYWLTRLNSRRETPAMLAFRNWLLEAAA